MMIYKKSGRFQKWIDDEDIPKRIIVEGTDVLKAYLIKTVPQYDDTELGKELYIKNLIRQKMFTDSVKSILFSLNDYNSVVELRFISSPKERLIYVYLVIKCFTKDQNNIDNVIKIFAEFERILPEDYEFEEVNVNKLEDILRLDDLKIIEIRKNISYVQVGKVFRLQSYEGIPGLLSEWDGEKIYSVPAIDWISWNENNWTNLFRIMQGADYEIRARISIASALVLKYDKSFANQFFGWLLFTYGNYSHYGGGEIDNYLRSFSKYLNIHNLFSLKIQFASKDSSTLESISQSFCSEISFGQKKTNLICFTPDVSNQNISYDWENCNHYYWQLPKFPESTSVDINEDAFLFLQRAPYIVNEEEVISIFRFPLAGAEGLPGIFSRPVKPFYQPSVIAHSLDVPQNDETKINIGRIIVSQRHKEIFSLSTKNLTKHGLIVGTTGSGKTNTTLGIIKQLSEHNIPFLVIEPVKSEYYNNLIKIIPNKKINLFDFRSPFIKDEHKFKIRNEFLRFNPFEPIVGITIAQHISYIKSCFNAAFPMYGIMPLILEESLRKLYSNSGWSLFELYNKPDKKDKNRVPVLSDLNNLLPDFIKEKFSSNQSEEWILAFTRRFEAFSNGVLGFSIDTNKWNSPDGSQLIDFGRYSSPLNTLLTSPSIIELDNLPDNEDKALIIAFILTFIFEHRQTLQDSKEKLVHVTIIEEAHRLLSSQSIKSIVSSKDSPVSEDSRTKSISLFMDMLAEIRAKGEGILIIEQIPSKLISDTLKNTNLKIVHRLTSKEDRDYLGESMNMNELQKKYITSLKTGEAIIFEESLDHPVMIEVERLKGEK